MASLDKMPALESGDSSVANTVTFQADADAAAAVDAAQVADSPSPRKRKAPPAAAAATTTSAKRGRAASVVVKKEKEDGVDDAAASGGGNAAVVKVEFDNIVGLKQEEGVDAVDIAAPISAGRRRSPRLVEEEAAAAADAAADAADGGTRTAESKQKKRSAVHVDEHGTPRSSSSKTLAADVSVIGSLVGEHIEPIGGQVKGAVMRALNGGKVFPAFNKMSGIQEWRNCIALFVNVGGGCYENLFSDDGERISWFAQRTQHEGTAVVQRMIKSQSGATTTPVVLFCRLPKQPYVCCGELVYESHDATRSPLAFTWRLQHYPELIIKPEFSELLVKENY
jgi:hypothetical protein